MPRDGIHVVLATIIMAWLQCSAALDWQTVPWQERWLNVTVAGQSHPVLTRHVGRGDLRLFTLIGGPGGTMPQLDFLSLFLDLDQFQIFQYDPWGSQPSACSYPREPCANNTSWMTVDGFVSMAQQVWGFFQLPPEKTVVVGFSFGVVEALEFLLRAPPSQRAAGLVLCDWVASQWQAYQRLTWCNQTHWRDCRIWNGNLNRSNPWLVDPASQGLTNRFLGRTFYGPAGDGVNGTWDGWDVRPQLWRLQSIPSLCFAGEFDIVYAEDVRSMCEAMGGTFVLVPKAGHFSFVDGRRLWLETFAKWTSSNFGTPAEVTLEVADAGPTTIVGVAGFGAVFVAASLALALGVMWAPGWRMVRRRGLAASGEQLEPLLAA